MRVWAILVLMSSAKAWGGSLDASQGTMLGVLYALGHALNEFALVIGIGLAAFGVTRYLSCRRQPMMAMKASSLLLLLVGLMFIGLYYITEIEF